MYVVASVVEVCVFVCCPLVGGGVVGTLLVVVLVGGVGVGVVGVSDVSEVSDVSGVEVGGLSVEVSVGPDVSVVPGVIGVSEVVVCEAVWLEGV